MLSSIAFIFVLSVLVIVHEFGHFIVAKLLKVRVEIFSIGFGKKLLSRIHGHTEYRFSLVPLGGYIKLAGDNPEEKREGTDWEFLSKSVGERAMIVLAGPIFNYLIAFLLFSFVFFIGVPTSTSKIGEVKNDYPAQAAGLQKGDRIIFVDGQKIKFWEELSALIHEKTNGEQVSLQLQREDQVVALSIIPKVEKTKNIFGQEIKIGLIGIAPSDEVETVRYGLLESVRMGAQQVSELTKMTYLVLFRMITGKMSIKQSVTGPIGIFYITGAAAKLGLTYLLRIMAALSVSLAIINLFPLPVLDGGHLLFLGVERIKGKPVSIKVQEISARIGISVLIVLMVFVFYNDLMRYGIFEKIFTFFLKK